MIQGNGRSSADEQRKRIWKIWKKAERTAQYLLENRLAGCAASDAHRANYRTPDMRPIREFLSEWYGESYAELLLKR